MTDENKFEVGSVWKEPRKGEFWVNVYNKNDAEIFYTKKAAFNDVGNGLIARVKVEWTEGEGLKDE